MYRLAFYLIFSFIVFPLIPSFAATFDSRQFGVIIGGKGLMPGIVATLQDLGVSWVRVNDHLDGQGQDIARFLDAGINVVITFDNHDPTNLDTTYGSPNEFINAGFPFKSKEIYQKRIKERLIPLVPYLKKGRQIWVQCENEIGDASLNPKSRYWRGTIDQYLTQLDAFYETVRSINPSIPIVLTSFPSESLDNVLDPSDKRRYKYASMKLTKLLGEGKYDAVDLHFYGCVEDIPQKVRWIKDHLPEGKRWITTENGGPDYRCPKTPLHFEKDPDRFEEIQAQQVSQRLTACAENGGSICLWFSLFNLRKEVETFRHMGLIDQSPLAKQVTSLKKTKGRKDKETLQTILKEHGDDIAQSLRKKPAYHALKSFLSTVP